jgi:hypothetical protein
LAQLLQWYCNYEFDLDVARITTLDHLFVLMDWTNLISKWDKLSAKVQERLAPVTDGVNRAAEKAWEKWVQPEFREIRAVVTQEGFDIHANVREALAALGETKKLGQKSKMASVTTIDLLTLATSLPYAGQVSTLNTIEEITFQQFDNSFSTILGANASWQIIANETWQAFHEAGVYNQETNSLYITSNWASDFSNPINMSILNLEDYSVTSQRYAGLASPNGGTLYVPPGTDGKPQIILCDEGNFDIASSLTVLDPVTKTTKVCTPTSLYKV